ncbi:glutamate 5-kinase [Opitutia bacterium KCR 482]|nr:glutamate 5-kinase [Opitutae bacterium KCR 482]
MSTDCAKRVIVKLGTGVLTSGVGQLDTRKMESVCKQIADAKKRGYEIVLVSSGAVGLGMGKLGLKTRPKQISAVQECAAVGQGILIQTWGELFAPFGITVAQILLTRDDVDVLERHKSLRGLIDRLLADGIVPIINENDCISAAGLYIKFGDNDVLSALVATLSKADKLLILSTAIGLIDMKGTGKVVPVVERITSKIREMASGTTSATAVGGMITKIRAAEIATSSGCDVYIASGSEENIVGKILGGAEVGTLFRAHSNSVSSKKRWLAHFGRTIGKIFVDSGAVAALRGRGSSLLPAGIKRISGDFKCGDLVEIADEKTGEIVARGLAEKSARTIKKLLSEDSHKKCGHKDVAVHRDNLAIV